MLPAMHSLPVLTDTEDPSLSNAVTESFPALSIFPYGAKSESTTTSLVTQLPWYSWWLEQQLKNVPQSIAGQLPYSSDFMTAYLKIAHYARTKECFSIDDIVAHLLNLDLVQAQDIGNRWEAVRAFVFAILGWQTMLYSPSFGTSPPQQLAIADVLDGFTGQAFMVLKQNQTSAKRSLPDFLLGFGLMLPQENICMSEDTEDRQAFESLAVINPGDFNAYLLQSIAKIRIKWVDVLAPHMEFDKATNTLFLFRYPSFCVANLPSPNDISSKGVIHR
jgi:hypothetical protein